MAEREGIEPPEYSFICTQPVLKTGRDTSPYPLRSGLVYPVRRGVAQA